MSREEFVGLYFDWINNGSIIPGGVITSPEFQLIELNEKFVEYVATRDRFLDHYFNISYKELDEEISNKDLKWEVGQYFKRNPIILDSTSLSLEERFKQSKNCNKCCRYKIEDTK